MRAVRILMSLRIMDGTGLFNLLSIWDVNLDGVRRELRVEQERGIQMGADKVRVDVPFREDLVCKTWSNLVSSEF